MEDFLPEDEPKPKPELSLYEIRERVRKDLIQAFGLNKAKKILGEDQPINAERIDKYISILKKASDADNEKDYERCFNAQVDFLSQLTERESDFVGRYLTIERALKDSDSREQILAEFREEDERQFVLNKMKAVDKREQAEDYWEEKLGVK